MKGSFLLLLCSFLLLAPSGLTAAMAFEHKPLFSVEIGEDSNKKLGKIIDEQNMKEYDRFYYPAAIRTGGDNKTLFVLDAFKHRICAYDLNGGLIYEIPAAEGIDATDIAVIPEKNIILCSYQNNRRKNEKSDIALISYKLSGGNKLAGHEIHKLKIEGLEKLKITDISTVQSIWPIGGGGHILASVFTDTYSLKTLILKLSQTKDDGAISYKIEAVGEAAPEIKSPIGSISGDFIAGIEHENEKYFLVTQKAGKDGAIKRLAQLPKEICLSPESGFLCRSSRMIGGDKDGNFYFQCSFGKGEDGVTNSYVYKVSARGKIISRTEIFVSPQMLSNRFITTDRAGRIYFMKNIPGKNIVEFHQF